MATLAAPRTASIVVPTRNRLAQLRYTLDSLRYQDAPRSAYEVIVVDDASEDGTPAWLEAYRPPYSLAVVRNDSQLGRGPSRNRGVEAATGDIIVFLDGDTVCPPTFVAAHLRLHGEGGRESGHAVETCVSGYPWCWRRITTVSYDSGKPKPWMDPASLARWEEVERWAGRPLGEPGTPLAIAGAEDAPFIWFVASACSVRRSLVLDCGGFDPRFRGYGWEDWELGYRLQQRGVRFLAHPTAAAYHQAHLPADRGSNDWRRNRGLFLEIHPEFEVALIFCCTPGTNGRYERLYRAYARARELAPTFASALAEVTLDYALGLNARKPRPVRGWSFWTARWGTERVARIAREQLTAMGDGRARPVVALFQQLAGLLGSDGTDVYGP